MDRLANGQREADRGGSGQAAPDVVAPPPGHPRFPLFDSMRAIALMCVFLVHTALGSGGIENPNYGHFVSHLDFGLAIFFAISGFLLYRPFVAGRAGQAKAPRIRDYARRRVLRIVPAYWVALTILAIYPGIGGVFSNHAWAYYGLIQYTTDVYSSACQGSIFHTCGIGPAWSLAVEASFYALLPIYVLLMNRLLRSRDRAAWVRVELIFLGALSLGSVVVRWWMFTDPAAGLRLRLDSTLLGTFYWFALGMTLALASVLLHGRERDSRIARVVTLKPFLAWGSAIGLYLVLASWLPQGPLGPNLTAFKWVTQYLAFGVITVLLLLPAVFGDHAGGLPRRVLAHPALAWLGLVSYGTFLWHGAVIGMLVRWGVNDLMPGSPFLILTLFSVAISVAFGAISYYVIERPFLRFKYQPMRVLRRPRSGDGPTSSAGEV